MKSIYLFISLLAFTVTTSAIDRFVDPFVSVGNGTTIFPTITSAVSAAVEGDRILIVPASYNEPALTINKSLTLLSQTEGGIVNYNANINISGFSTMKLQIIGFNLGSYIINGNTVTSGSNSNRAILSLINCTMSGLNINNPFYDLNCIGSKVNGNLNMTYGSVVTTNVTGNFFVLDETGSNTTGKVFIVQDTINGRFNYNNDNHTLTLCNNLLRDLYIWSWNSLTTNTNKILNNDFFSNCYLFLPFGGTIPGYNFDFSNNQFLGAVYFYNGGDYYVGYPTYNYFYRYGTNSETGSPFSTSTSSFPNPSVSGFFKWTYNGIDLPCTVPVSGYPLVLTKVIGSAGTNNTGNPAHDYYDIDLTVNNRGRTGGPYGIGNYQPSINPSNGKAFIFDLDIPADLYPGQSVNINAKGYHKN